MIKSGVRVAWKYVSGKGMYGMGDRAAKGGQGFLELNPSVGSSLFISGDLGLTTTAIKSIEQKDDEITITTNNSVYVIKELK